ncbi:lipase family alpha/beta hydrolase [Streptomyces hygroscopicus]|uniref:lipase family alpha/beta hydrolase n=1 Tax=Streptomyces hygroscopicus TaxID=1912 RepID=UPI00367DFE22
MLINHLPQATFREQQFDSSGVNLHTRPKGTSREVVVFVHGLGGGGYDTWHEMPRMIFEGRFGASVDVAVFDYPSGLRAWKRRGADLAAPISRLTATLSELTTRYEYSDIYIAAHSLGGLITEAAIQRIFQGLHQSPVTALAAVILFASPRVGSGWATIPAFREARWLKRFSDRVTEAEEYYSTYVEGRATPDANLKRFFLPHYACVASDDLFVSRFSAGVGIPAQQRLPLEGSHTSVVKPDDNDHPQVRWLHQIIEEAAALRAYVISRVTQATQTTPSTVIVAELRTDFHGTRWENIYHDVRERLSSASIEIVDKGAYPDAPVDALLTVRSADGVLEPNSPAQGAILKAYAEHWQSAGRCLVGVCAVGACWQDAKRVMTQWLPADAEGSFYVEGAPDEGQLYAVLTNWLQAVIKRNSQRMQDGSRIDRLLDLAPDPYDIPERKRL